MPQHALLTDVAAETLRPGAPSESGAAHAKSQYAQAKSVSDAGNPYSACRLTHEGELYEPDGPKVANRGGVAVQRFFIARVVLAGGVGRAVRLLWPLLALSLLGAGGCTIPSPASVRLSEAGPVATETTSEVARLALSGPTVARYLVVDPETMEPTGAEAIIHRDGPGEEGAWRLRIGWRSARAGARVRWMQQIDGDTAPDGALRFLSIRDASSRSKANFEPGLVVAPRLLGGAAQIQEISVALEEPGGQRRLRGRNTIASAGRELIDTPAGTRAALRVHLDSAASLGPVTGRRRMAVWLAEGQGVVAQYQSDTLLVFGIPTSSREMLLLAAPEPADVADVGRLISADGEMLQLGRTDRSRR